MINIKITILSFLVASLNAQVAQLNLLNKLYPSQPILYTNKEENIIITNDKTGLLITKHVKEQFIILNETGKSFNERSVYTNTFIEVKNVKASTHVPNGNKYSKYDVDDIKITDANSNGTFYDGNKKITIVYPNTTPGALINLEYDEIYKEPRFFGSYYITEFYPVLKATFTIKYPSSVVLNTKSFNTAELNIVATEKLNSKNEKLITLLVDSVKAYKPEDYSPHFKSLASYYLFNIKEYQLNNTTVQLVGSLDNLYNWYLALVNNLNKSPSPQLKQITDSLTAHCTTEIEKVKKIYYWVQDKIAYLAYEDGLGGYVPREADIICKRRFGDCKDMASILNSMGRAANLPIYLTWIGTRDIPYQFSEVPAPMAANHMIAAYLTKDTCLFLDATGKHQDLGTHTSFIQGKEAIIGINEREYIIKTVPDLSHLKNYYIDSVSVKIVNKTLVGSGIIKTEGYNKVNLQERISGKSYKELYQYFNGYCQKGNNKFKLDTVVINKNQRDCPLEIYYTFKLPDYITETSKEIFANLNFDKYYMEDYSTKDKKFGLEFNFAFTKKMIVNLLLEENNSVKFLPSNVLYNKNNFFYQTSYVARPMNIVFTSSIIVKNKTIPKTDFPVWEEFLTEQNKNNNKSISLNKL